MSTYPDRIPYQSWINSQLSIARHFGGVKLNGETYKIEQATNDLVKVLPKPKRIKKIK